MARRKSIRRFLSTINARTRVIFILGIGFVLALSFPIGQGISTLQPGNKSASFYFVQPRTKLYINNEFNIDLRVKSERTAINAVGTVLQFDPNYIEIINISTEQSFCSLYLESSFDPQSGKVRISCGTPQPGFSGDSLIVSISIRPKLPGTTFVTLQKDETMALANDSKGTNILGEAPYRFAIDINQGI